MSFAGDTVSRLGRGSSEERAAARRRLSHLARLLDTAVRIPGLGIRFGLDPVLGLVPGAGDLVAGAISTYLILEARRLGAPKSLLLRMAGNVAVDTVVGAIPLAGSVFDIFYRANSRNMKLLDEWLGRLDGPMIEGTAVRED